MTNLHALRSDPIGPIRVSPNGRHFTDPNGKPVFWLSDTQWELFRLHEPETALRILRDRQFKGFNAVLVMLLGVESGRFKLDTPAAHVNMDGEPPWFDGDPLRPNERYFRRIDDAIRLGERTEQTLVVGVYHQWHVDLITTGKARAWARWIAERYREVPNLIWSMYPKATDEYIPVCRELAAGLREGDGGAHLISVHPDPAVASSSFLGQEDWLAFHTIQTCTHYDRIYEAVTSDRSLLPAMPVVMAEGGYEGVEFGKLQTPHAIRKQAYWTQLAGGYHGYGHNDNWAAPLAWERWLDSPGSRHLRIFRDFITSLDEWWDLVPDPTLLASGAGEGFRLNVAARPASGRWILAYLSEPSTVSIRLDALRDRNGIHASWIDPRSGDLRPAAIPKAPGAPSFTTPEGWEDALVILTME